MCLLFCSIVCTIYVATPLWGKCEDEIHTPKSGNLESSKTPKNSELDCRGQKTLHWGVFLYRWKGLEVQMSKMALNEPFGHLQHKLWSKEGSRVKLAIWLLTIKSRESTQFRCVQVKCNTPLKSSWRELQLCFKPHPNWRSELGVMSSQSPESPNWDTFGTPPWESRDKKSFGCSSYGRTQIILYGGRWWLPRVRVVVSQVNMCCPWLVPMPRLI
jgi:hypothetical protein